MCLWRRRRCRRQVTTAPSPPRSSSVAPATTMSLFLPSYYLPGSWHNNLHHQQCGRSLRYPSSCYRQLLQLGMNPSASLRRGFQIGSQWSLNSSGAGSYVNISSFSTKASFTFVSPVNEMEVLASTLRLGATQFLFHDKVSEE